MVHLKSHSSDAAQDLGEKILELLNTKSPLDTNDIGLELNEDHQKIVGAVKSLEALGNVRFFAGFLWKKDKF